MQSSIKNFKTKLSTQFATFTTMLIATTVFFIAWYSISTLNNMTQQMSEQAKDLNDAISITLFKSLSDTIEKGDFQEVENTAQKMVDSNIVALVIIKNAQTNKRLLVTK